ncbi:synapsin II [Pelomyxa schiedti]|nr:synapsin II [Pelomyxa schiedti]
MLKWLGLSKLEGEDDEGPAAAPPPCSASTSTPTSTSTTKKTASSSGEGRLNVLVCDGDATHDWPGIMASRKLSDGRGMRVVQASWMDIVVVAYSDSGALVSCAPMHDTDGVVKPAVATFMPDFVIIRNQVRGPTPGCDRRNSMFGLMSANVPSMNSCLSEYMNLERPLMNGALREIEKRLGHDKFPFIAQTYYSSGNDMVISPDLPCIVKVSHAHRGMGKIKAHTQEQFRDIATVLALHPDYCTAEHFIEAEYGIRVQKIGSHYRVMKKIYTGSGWKSQFGGADLQEVPLTPEYKLWVDECAKCFGGMDWLAVDALHGTDGQDYVIEMNGAAIGLLSSSWLEDTNYMLDLVMQRMNEIYVH